MPEIRWKPGKGKTWKDKLIQEHPNHGKIVPIPPRMRKSMGSGRMVIPRPLDVDALMRRARKGKLITFGQIRREIAAQYGVEQACPLTTGIFLRIAAEAAAEDLQAGKKRVTPYWRTIKDDGKLNEKFPGGARAQAALLRKEGFTLERRKGAATPRVAEFERYLTSV